MKYNSECYRLNVIDFLDKKEIPDKAIDKIKSACSKKQFEILRVVKCGQYSPGKYRICVDFRIL